MTAYTGQVEHKRRHYWAILLFLLLLAGVLCLGGVLFFPGRSTAQETRLVPVHLHSVLEANYRVDPNPPRFPGVRLDLIWDVIFDKEQGDMDLEARQAALLTSLQTPVPFVTSPVCQGSHTIYVDQDTWVDSARPTATYGNDTVLKIGRDGNHLKRILLNFTLNNRIPQGTFIYSARLEMNVAGGAAINTPPFQFYNLRDPFEASLTNWSNQPEVYTNYRPPPLTIPDIHAWDVTDIVQAWLLGHYPNNGLVLEPQSSDDFTLFYYSQEAGKQTNREFTPVSQIGPRLIIDCEALPSPEMIAAATPTTVPNPTNTSPTAPARSPTPPTTNTPPLLTTPLSPTPPLPTPPPSTPTVSPPTSTSPPPTPTTSPPTPTSPPPPPPTPTPTDDSSDDDDDDSPDPAPPPPPPPSANLAIGKTGAPNPVTAGNNLTYNLNITNNGPSNATGVTVIDTLPTNVILVSATPSQGTCSGTSTITCNLGTIINGGNATITIVVTVDPLATGTLTNSATVSATETDPDPGNNTATINTNVTPISADLAITKSVDQPTPNENDTIVYTLIANNNGPANATSVVVTDTLPGGVTYVSDNSGGAYNSGTGAWNVGALNNGASVTLLITATVNPGTINTTITNTATITTTAQVDPNISNNTDNVPITVVPKLSISDVTVTEPDAGTVSAIFTVTLSAASTQIVTVDYTTADGTATVGNNDYVATTNTLPFLVGTTQQTITVQVNGDTVAEGDETFSVNLSAPSNATISDSQGIGTILNDDIACSSSITLTATGDTWLQESAPDTNQEGDINLSVKPDASPGMRALFQYNLGSISPGTTVCTATLLLYEQNNIPGQTIFVHRVTTSWSAATATWNSPWTIPGGDYISPAATSFVPDTIGVRSVDITSLAQYWVDNPGSNFGSLLRSTTSGALGIVQFRSLEDPAGTPPRLVVVY